MSPHVWLLAHNLSSAAILGTGMLGIVIWIGVAVLLVALLILMRTRWGQSATAVQVRGAVGVRPPAAVPVRPRHATARWPTHAGRATTPIHVAFIAADAPTAGRAATRNRPRNGRSETVGSSCRTASRIEPRRRSCRQRIEAEVNAMTAHCSRPRLWRPAPTIRCSRDDVPHVISPCRPTIDPPQPVAAAAHRSIAAATGGDRGAAVWPPPPPRPTHRYPLPHRCSPERIETAPAQRSVRRVGPSVAQLPADLMAIGSQMQQLADVEARSETADALRGPQRPVGGVGESWQVE